MTAVDHFEWQSVKQRIMTFSVPVLIVWFCLWLLPLLFSRLARFLSKRGHESWASRCLLPAYELAIVFKKLGLLVLIIDNGADRRRPKIVYQPDYPRPREH